jgi:ribulose-5-phosphate 4-epimerase/fuculose-1-phosphate aldolase
MSCLGGYLATAAGGVASFLGGMPPRAEGASMGKSFSVSSPEAGGLAAGSYDSVSGSSDADLSAGVPPAQDGRGDTDEQRIADLVMGNHILFDQGVVDGFGHISARCVKNPAHFWMSQSRAPGMVSKDDIMEFNENSEAVDARGRSLYGERFIHGEIYRARPDVISVVHSHAPGVIPFGLTGVALRPVIHTAGFLPPVTPVFEIRDVAGEDNGILVKSNKLGAGLAKVLGKSPVVLMRGHGDTVVGPSVKVAVYRAIYTQLNAQILAESLMLGQGKVVYLNSMESAKVNAINETGGVQRVWQIWQASANANLAVLKGN